MKKNKALFILVAFLFTAGASAPFANVFAQANSNGTTSTTTTNTFIINRQEVLATSTDYINVANVISGEDFSTYSKSLMMNDRNISKIEAKNDAVSIWYDQPAKILGIVPVTFSLQASIDVNGNVIVTYPWWYEVFVKDDNKTEFQADLDNTAGTIVRGEATTTLSFGAKARVINAMQSIMKNRYDMMLSTSTSETRAY